MPNKTIYVPDADLQVFDQAQKVSGNNLSATIVQALRYFVKIGEGKGFEQVDVLEGENGFYKRKRFIGRELASASVYDDADERMTNYIVYETVHGRYAVLITEEKKIPLEQSIERELEKRIMERLAGENKKSIQISKEEDVPDIRRLEVYDSIDMLAGHVPGDLYRALHEIRDGEFLDI
ncbi:MULTISPECIES: EXLDI protein [unclassified Sporolactobacillus]|uniref:EXLDI protein n=1 Tax=unclassified Sporolactobacillus TaxID=2628533 RepID=UPI0023685FAD|nr:EXLDI protein [Sporolactobacillus sp. CQH2019]MDD9148761.1 EXLDI protein [Sporolactobacillus sp. CQH2019]